MARTINQKSIKFAHWFKVNFFYNLFYGNMEEIVEKVTLTEYNDSNIITLEGLEHIRRRPGMYIGKLGDGSHPDDGIYVLLKEVMDNCIDEFRMGAGKTIEVQIVNDMVQVRDYGRGIPLGKMIESVSIMNTGGK